MKKLSNEELNEIKILIGQAKAIEKTMTEVLNQSDSSNHRFISCISYIRMYQTIANASAKYIPLNAVVGKFDINNLPNPYDLTGAQLIEWFQTALASVRILISLLEANFDYIDNEYNKIDNLINSKLRALVMEVPENEKEIQLILQAGGQRRDFRLKHHLPGNGKEFSAKAFVTRISDAHESGDITM